jgi:hypothetical protein
VKYGDTILNSLLALWPTGAAKRRIKYSVPVFLGLLATATPAFAQRYQCVGKATAANGAQSHVILFVNEKGEREDGMVAWTPPAASKTGIPFTVDLLYGMGSLETGTFFNPAGLSVNLTVPLDPAPARTLKVAVATPTSGSRITRPWQKYDQAVAAGDKLPIEGIISFNAGDGSDGVFYAIEDKDPTLTVDVIGDAGAVIGKQVFDLAAIAQRDQLAKQAFDHSRALAADPRKSCQLAR